MTDERFDHDLKFVLREIAGEETPMSLRNRVAAHIDQAPLGRRLWFAPPLKLSVAAVAAVAVVALAVFFVAPRVVGPTPSQSPEFTASASASPAEPTATLEPTPVPTSMPTTGVSAWTGLEWSDGVLGIHDDSGSALIADIMPWGDGYVGVGSFVQIADASGEQLISAAFFTSADGMHWTITDQGTPFVSYDGDATVLPSHVVPVDSGLLAVGGRRGIGEASPNLWRTEDGLTWIPVDSPTWRDAWTTNTFMAVAAGRAGLVAVGAEGSMCCLLPQGPPVITYSADGLKWDRLDLSAVFDQAYFQDVATYAGGFVIVGRVGEQDDWRGGNGSGIGRPAAWTSPDGVTWVAAQVESSEAAGATLSKVVAGADGLFATGLRADTSSTLIGGQGPISGWASADGQTWHLVGQLGTDLPDATVFAGDGTHMLMFGRESCKTTALLAWASTDGVTWTPLDFSGATAIPDIRAPICEADGTEGSSTGGMGVTYAVVVPNGVLVGGYGGPPQEFWFATATGQ